MFQIKNQVSITASCINWMKAVTTKVTDFSVGSIVRTMLEAVASEIDELYMRMLIGLQEAIPVSVYNSFGFDQLPAVSASGLVRFTAPTTVTVAVTVPAGTAVRLPGGSLLYLTAADATIGVGQVYVDTLVVCNSTGAAGNVSAGVLTEIVAPVTGIASASNPAAFINGADLETDSARQARFRGFISNLARGTGAALVYGAKTANLVDAHGLITEYIAHAAVVEPWVADTTQPISLVKLYVYSATAPTTGPLLAKTQQIINGYYDSNGNAVPGWKAAGVVVNVIGATAKAVNVTGVVAILPNFDGPTVRAAVQNAIGIYLLGLDVAQTALEAEIVAIAKRDVPGVANFTIAAPLADVTALASEKIVPGVFTLT